MATGMIKRFTGRRAHGFTLLELLIVVALMAIVGVGAVSLILDTEETVGMDLVQAEIRAVRDAILQFKKDTGCLPRTGIFDLASRGARDAIDGGAAGKPFQGEEWFYSPANFDQLIEEPVNDNGDPIMPWNPDTGRGWRGPYLQKADGWVDVGNGLTREGAGSPTTGTILKGIHGVADPFLHESVKQYFVWHSWDDKKIKRYGRPYYFFDWEYPERTRLVSSGPDGIYQSQDFAEQIDPNDPVDIGDDIVIFLFR